MNDTELLTEVFNRFTIPELVDYQNAVLSEGSVIPTSRRLGLYPITDPVSFAFYKKQVANFWAADEADFTKDMYEYLKLDADEQHLLGLTEAIFSFQDGNVIENLVARFMLEAPTVEGRIFYGVQNAIEIVHAHSYSEQIANLFPTQIERDRLFQAVDNLEFLKRKNELNDKYTKGKMSLAERQVAYTCLEGIGFSALFAVIFSFKYRTPYVALEGIYFSNEKISEDEGLHRAYGITQVRIALGINDPNLPDITQSEIRRQNRGITPERVLEIIKEFVEVELACADEILPRSVRTLSNAQLKGYITYVADRMLIDCGLPVHYGNPNPLPFMDLIGLLAQHNFFEKTVGAYQRPVMNQTTVQKEIVKFDDDF